MSSDPNSPHHVASVPQGRTRRFLHIGRAVGELAAGAAAEAVSRWARGQGTSLSQLIFTPGNARRLAERLSAMRGAVMKVGQLMSMDGQGVLPPEFAHLLGGLRDRAHHMPTAQLMDLLRREYGAQWPQRFMHFDAEPIASASIGQVHRVRTIDGRVLALKIQHPGVRKSIDSDIDNLALVARLPGLVPGGLDVAPVLQRVREQLHREADYRAEARAAAAYRNSLGPDPVLVVPAVHSDYCTAHILASDFMLGVPIDRLALAQYPQALRDSVASALCRLALRVLFEMRRVQTDPNFGNYLFDEASGRIALLDFGATERLTLARVQQLRALACALRDNNARASAEAAEAVGLIAIEDPAVQTQALVGMMLMAGEPLRHAGAYDFAASDLFSRGFAAGRGQALGAGFSRIPSADLLFLQRKFVGTFMQCARLRARVDVAALFAEYL